MISNVFLCVVVTVLFTYSAVQSFDMVVQKNIPWYHRIDHIFHGIMCVAMIIMAWPQTVHDVPNIPAAVFFVVATLWFIIRWIVKRGDTVDLIYNTAMMLTMVWMYVLMQANSCSRHGGGHGKVTTASASSGGHHDHMNMGHDVLEYPMIHQTNGHHGSGSLCNILSFNKNTCWVWWLDCIITVGYTAVAVWFLYQFFVNRSTQSANKSAEHSTSHLIWGGIPMAIGTALMFAVTL